MTWTEQDPKTRVNSTVTAEREKLLNEVKKSSLHQIQKESEGVRPFNPIQFQPVRSPGIYEGEFGVRGKDLLFHFWAWGSQAAMKDGNNLPAFPRGFGSLLERAMTETFDKTKVGVVRDEDVGAWSVKVLGYAEKQFYRDLAIKACERLHQLLGGKTG